MVMRSACGCCWMPAPTRRPRTRCVGHYTGLVVLVVCHSHETNMFSLFVKTFRIVHFTTCCARILPLFVSRVQTLCLTRHRCRHCHCVNVIVVLRVLTQYGETALIDTACYGQPDCMRLLLDAGADTNVADKVCARSSRAVVAVGC